MAEINPSPADLQAGLKMLVDKDFLVSEKYKEQQWRADRKGAHNEILDFERAFIRRLLRLGVPMFAHNMVRSVQDQNGLYARGVSKAAGDKSPHVHGMAVDIVHSRFAWDLHPAQWSLIGHIGKEVAAQNGIDIVWGGDWKFYDPAHWELADWKGMIGL